MYRTLDPSTGELLQRYETATEDEISAALRTVGKAFAKQRASSFEQRGGLLERIADKLEQKAAEYGELMALEMGKPLAQGIAEAQKCAWVCRYYADNAERLLATEERSSDGSDAYVRFDPIGAVLAIMPWNFPFWQLFRFAVPAIAAGNTVLLKHAENVPGCAEAIEGIWRDAGAPDGLVANLRVEVDRVADVIRDPAVRAVTFTGSARGGRAVAECAGAALKKTVLELGGSDPYVVLEDADVERAADTCVTARMVNGGQTCVAAKRLIVVDAVRDEFTARVVERMRERRFGAPTAEPPPHLGPMARADLRDALHRQVTESVAAGAALRLGGEIPEGPGFYYPPTVLADVPRDAPAFREETFGPVAAIVPVRDEAEAIERANESPYGLGGAVFTRDTERGERIARDRIQVGCCVVNDFVRSDPRLPFGGIKDSGWGRELSEFGLREFVNVKTVVVGRPD